MSDYEVTVKIRNTRILSRIRAAGHATIKAFCDAHKALDGPTESAVRMLLNIRLPAAYVNGQWRDGVVRLAAVLGCEPEDLFTDRQRQGGAKALVTTATEAQVERLSDLSPMLAALEGPDQAVYRKLLEDDVAAALGNLNERDADVIRRRYGLDPYPEAQTLEQIAQHYQVNRERVRQIELRGHRTIKAKENAHKTQLKAWLR
jgi:RNA polymerase sigma factor (sigma-70 family)